jgi:hypothetical protein
MNTIPSPRGSKRVRTCTSPTGKKIHLRTNGSTLCRIQVTDSWPSAGPVTKAIHNSDTCKHCLREYGSNNVKVNKAEEHAEAYSGSGVSTAANTSDAAAVVDDMSGTFTKLVDDIVAGAQSVAATEGEYTEINFVLAVPDGVEILDKRVYDNNRLFSMLDMNGDHVRTIYYALREYQDKLVADLSGGLAGSLGQEDYVFLSTLLNQVARLTGDLENKFGGPSLLGFARNIVNVLTEVPAPEGFRVTEVGDDAIWVEPAPEAE